MNETVPLIPRKLFFGNPDRASVTISPDGERLAWLASRDGVLNVWVAPRENPADARPVTADTGRGIRFYQWAFTGDHILYLQDMNGDENWRVYVVDLASGKTRDLTPLKGVAARVLATSHRRPAEALVLINDRDPQWHDIYCIDLTTGERTLLLQNERFMDVVADDNLRLRAGMEMTADGGLAIHVPDDAAENWHVSDTVPMEDVLTTAIVGYDKTGRLTYLIDSRGRDTAALFEVDPAGVKRILAEDPRADTADILRHPTERHAQAAAFTYERKHWQILDPAIAADLEFLATVADGDVEITSRSLDDRYWLAAFVVDDGPARYYLYDRERGAADFLFTNRAELEGLPLARMRAVVIKARDGLDLVAYYSLPPGFERSGGMTDHPQPLVLIPHGGPWARDVWGFNGWHQWLANRGYVVLSVNFRSSTGFGKSFTNAGDGEWGRKILEDQQDAVAWAVAWGIADPGRVAVMGGSFGGYSTLAGLTFYPEVFACGVDIVGPSNLITLLETIPPYWQPMIELFMKRVGDSRTEAGRALLTAHSPLTYADRIVRPLLIAQGANDPRVKQAESDQIVALMQEKGIPVTYVLYPDEGHGFARPENNLSFAAMTEAFLSSCLGGRAEPIGGDFAGSSLVVLAGAGDVPGLEAALTEAEAAPGD